MSKSLSKTVLSKQIPFYAEIISNSTKRRSSYVEIKLLLNIFLNPYENILGHLTHWQKKWSWRLGAEGLVGHKHCLPPVLQGGLAPEGQDWYQTWSTGLPGMLPIKVGQRWASASFNDGLGQISGEQEEKPFYIKWCNENSPLREYPTGNSSLWVLPLAHWTPTFQVISFS